MAEKSFKDMFKVTGETLITSYIHTNLLVNIQCKQGHVYAVTPTAYRGGRRCYVCDGTYNLRGQAHFEAVAKIRGDSPKTPYTGSKGKVKMVCKEGHTFEVIPNNYIQKWHGCLTCKSVEDKKEEKFVDTVTKTIDNTTTEKKTNKENPTMKTTTTSRKVANAIKSKTGNTFAAYISVVDFLDETKYEENPVQRDHEERAKKKEHLKGETSSDQTVVHVAVLGKTYILLDGHSRRYAWSIGQLTMPEELLCIYHVISERNEAITLYKHYDNKAAAETPKDSYLSSQKELGMVFSSELLQGSQRQSLQSACMAVLGHKKLTDFELLKKFKEELLEIDSWNHSAKKRSKQGNGKLTGTGVKSAMIVSLYDNPDYVEDVQAFWYDFFNFSDADSVGSVKRAYQRVMNSEHGPDQAVLTKDLQVFVKEFIRG